MSTVGRTVTCPLCNMKTTERAVNEHLDKGCPTPSGPVQSGAAPTPVKRKPSQSTPQRSLSFFSQSQGIQGSQENTVDQEARSNNVRGEPDSSPIMVQSEHKVNDQHAKRKGDEQQQQQQQNSEKRQKVMLSSKPLAEQVRPTCLEDFVGQQDLVGPQGILRTFIENDSCPSMILWGPSGVGKTSLARIIAKTTKARFVELSAAVHSTTDVKKVFEEARNEQKLLSRKTILFLDEIHRFNRAQQDAFLPHVEKGDITLIGATTENPSFKINGALISRTRVFVLKKLTKNDISTMLSRAVETINSNRNHDNLPPYEISREIIEYLAGLADGDGRIALNILEISLNSSNVRCKDNKEVLSGAADGAVPTGSNEAPHVIDLDYIKSSLKRTHMLYDRVGDSHYDTISALHKSVRGSDPDAALFYLGRMLQSGEDPLYIARRMVRMASEDIGLRDDSCLPFATAAYTAVQQIGMPEADCILAHCAVKLAKAPKSVQVYKAYNEVKAFLQEEPGAAAATVPIHLRNAPTKLMKEIGYGKEYKYNPDYIDGKVVQQYMPDGLEHIKFLGKRHLGTNYDHELDEQGKGT